MYKNEYVESIRFDDIKQERMKHEGAKVTKEEGIACKRRFIY